MCGIRIWGLAGALACSHLAYLSYAHVQRGKFDWPHDAWSVVTYGVWMLFMAGLIRETRCRRERAFFALVLTNFAVGFVFVVWRNASAATVRRMRIGTAGLWAVAALASLVLTFSSGRDSAAEKKAS